MPITLPPRIQRAIAALLARYYALEQFRRLAILWIAGTILLGATTWLCSSLALSFATAASAFLVVIVLLSLLDSFASSVFFGVLAGGLLNYYFVLPRHTLEVRDVQDIAALVAFLVCSLAVTTLVRRLRVSAEVQREQARLLELTNDAFVVRDMDGIVTGWNRGAETLYGWTREEAIGRPAIEVLAPTQPELKAELDRQMRTTGRWEGELTHHHRDGSEIHVAARWSMQFDERGNPLRVLESNSDITEKKRADEALRRSQAAYLAEAQRLSRTGSFGWNTAEAAIHWSDETFRIFGYPVGESASLEMFHARVHPEDSVRVRQVLGAAATGSDGFDFEYRLLMPDGSVKHVHAVAHAMANGGGAPHYIGAVSDVTESREAYATLDRLQADLAHASRVSVLGELTASIAHEINQPLAAIAANGDVGLRWLSRPDPDMDELREINQAIVDDARRAADIITRIRAMAGRKATQQGRVLLDDVIGEALLFLRHELQSRGVTVTQQLALAAPPVLGDRIQLQQVVVNLAVNSMQAMAQAESPDRRIAIRTSLPDAGMIRCTIEDSGPGISADHQARLFDSFFSTKQGGMGIGLPICRSIIEAHGGVIAADSAATGGGGASFSFTLPVAGTAD
ncbi:PAS domain-containing protein [Sphingomonas sp.]|uniref:PAS domain-containing protein n=1 Tax=Sphingomonas sp. TaxID=28214 RepID=UPI001AFE9627|nr:PAS domain-containing protein [Sphingomonas sp.]MBO9714227.1 PAS domain S-box protein [Sphingomonas sp.]